MKTITPRRLIAVFTVVASVPLVFAEAAAAKPGQEKSHVLFMGADLAVVRDTRLHRVEDVVGSELKIKIGKKEFFVPTRNRPTNLKVNHGLKLSPFSVQLDGLQSGPAYTPANDPKHKFNRESGAAGGAAAVQDLAYGRMIDMNLQASQAGIAASGQVGTAANAARAEAEAMQGRADQAMRDAAAMSGQMQYSNQYDTGAAADRMYGELAQGNFDAMEVSFKISSPVELDDPHMVILFRFKERDAKPGDEGMLIHAKALEPIGPKPKYIRVRESGLPVGFRYVGCTVHIYNRGEEIATNESPKRVELSREEAQQYLVIEHIGANKGATVPAIAVQGTLPLPRRQQLTPTQLSRVCYAKVSDDGTLLGAYQDESCHQPLDDAAAVAALQEVFFKPALDQGKPVEGVARLTLGAI